MKISPEFFGWPADRRERFAVTMADVDENRLEAALASELFGRGSAAKLTLGEQNRWNEAILPFKGIGEDSFFLNEYFAEGESILDFETLRAYDEDDYRFQEKVRKEQSAGYQDRPYRGSLYLEWARLFVDGQFTYATLSMAAGYVVSELDAEADEIIGRRIPHRYRRGKNHGKREGDSWEWDLRVDAGGQEGILDELRRRVYAYTAERYEALLDQWDARGRIGVYVLETSEPPECNYHFVFTDRQALEKVRFRSFLRDCRRMERAVAELNEAVDGGKQQLAIFIEEQHGDVKRNFDPKVAKLRKRTRIMVHKNAFDELG